MDLFDGFNGKISINEYTEDTGQPYILLFVFIFNICLVSTLIAMFINRLRFVWQNLSALRRMAIIKLKNTSTYDDQMGAITITFFPISIILLPFILPLYLFQSDRLSDFVLKMQYFLMICLYCIIASIISLPIIPLLYIKILGNALYMAFTNKREDYKGQNLLNLIYVIVLGPVVIFVSLLVDLIALPNLLMKNQRDFEFKYQQSIDGLTAHQLDIVLAPYLEIFYTSDFKIRFMNNSMTTLELMLMHRRIFFLTDNLHDLICRGNKDYKTSLANVEDYNKTKILGRKCAIPDLSGDIRNASVHFNIMQNIQMDLEVYNYMDACLKQYFSGDLTMASLNRDREKIYQTQLTPVAGVKIHAAYCVLVQDGSYARDNLAVMDNFFI